MNTEKLTRRRTSFTTCEPPDQKLLFYFTQRITDSVKQLLLPLAKILMSPFMSKNTASQTSAVVKESYICWLLFRMGTGGKENRAKKEYCFWQFLFYLFPFWLFAEYVPPQNTHAWLSWARFKGAKEMKGAHLALWWVEGWRVRDVDEISAFHTKSSKVWVEEKILFWFLKVLKIKRAIFLECWYLRLHIQKTNPLSGPK
jgi:hypothetical protein